MKAILFPNVEKSECYEITEKIISELKKYNSEIVFCSKVSEFAKSFGYPSVSGKIKKSDADIAIVIGGDGSIINASRELIDTDIPIIGINMGTLGFLCDIEKDETDKLSLIFEKKYTVEERMVLSAEIKKKAENIKLYSVNDIVICKNAFSKIIDFDIYCSGIEMAHYRGDGVIFSTSFGSTAYAMSAGGPIIHPNVKLISITPICVHSLLSRTLIVPENEKIVVKTNSGTQKRVAYITVDGVDTVELFENDTITIQSDIKKVKFICIEGKSFYSSVNKKLIDRKL